MVLIQLFTIMLLTGSTAVCGTMLLRIAYLQQASHDSYWASVTMIGLACITFAVLALVHFFEPFIAAIGVYV